MVTSDFLSEEVEISDIVVNQYEKAQPDNMMGFDGQLRHQCGIILGILVSQIRSNRYAYNVSLSQWI